jgi:protein-tyrosine phosphatase
MSFSFFFRKKPQNLFRDMVDFHNHILPGIDDGSKSIAQSLMMLDLYQDLEIKAVIASPHIYKELYPNTPESISKSFETLSPKAIQKNVQIKGYAAEYLVDDFFLEHLQNNTSLLCCFDQHVLIEIPFFGTLKLLEQAVFTMQNMGYTAVLAHPERYANLKNESLNNLRIRGVKLQLNALSLMGHYGPEVKKKASEWLTRGLYDFVGTDAHNEQQLLKLKSLRLNKKQNTAWIKVCEQQAKQVNI